MEVVDNINSYCFFDDMIEYRRDHKRIQNFIRNLKKGDVEKVREELKYIPDINKKIYVCGLTSMYYACNYHQTEIIKLLVEYGASFNTVDMISILNKSNDEIYKCLIECGYHVTLKDMMYLLETKKYFIFNRILSHFQIPDHPIVCNYDLSKIMISGDGINCLKKLFDRGLFFTFQKDNETEHLIFENHEQFCLIREYGMLIEPTSEQYWYPLPLEYQTNIDLIKMMENNDIADQISEILLERKLTQREKGILIDMKIPKSLREKVSKTPITDMLCKEANFPDFMTEIIKSFLLI